MRQAKVLRLFYKAIFSSVFNSGNPKWIIAGNELLTKRTFRLPDSSYDDRLVGLRVLRRAFTGLNCSKIQEKAKYDVLILDANKSVYDLRKEYIKLVKNYDDSKIVGLTKDRAFEFIKSFNSKCFLLLLAFIVLPVTFFSKNRVQWSLIFFEFLEISAAVKLIGETKVKTIHFFSPAEKDANLAYLIFNRLGVKIVKHPSPGALVSHNKNLMTDILAISSNYQKEEFQIELKKTITANEIELWPPEISFKHLNLYKERNQEFKYRFGFYSHGGWIRVKTGKTNGLFANPMEEEKCLNILSQFMKNKSNERLIIFLHPKEKLDMKTTESYYFKWFDKDQIVFYAENSPSSMAFYDAEFGIGSYSTILFERDYFGFKSILMREEEKDFPLKGTGFYQNSFSSSEELQRVVNNYSN